MNDMKELCYQSLDITSDSSGTLWNCRNRSSYHQHIFFWPKTSRYPQSTIPQIQGLACSIIHFWHWNSLIRQNWYEFHWAWIPGYNPAAMGANVHLMMHKEAILISQCKLHVVMPQFGSGCTLSFSNGSGYPLWVRKSFMKIGSELGEI